jgi:PIN domain nuclease of toxin-antitoxin system
LVGDLPGILEDNGFEVLPVEFADAAGVRDLKPFPGDPFDRIQVVQARRRGFSVISRDPVTVTESAGFGDAWSKGKSRPPVATIHF